MRLLVLLAFLLLSAGLSGQQLDSLHLPSTTPDSLFQSPQQQLDSAQRAFYERADLLKNIHKSRLSSLDSSEQNVQHRIDSLGNLGLPTERYTHQLDSIRQEKMKTVTSLNAKMEELKSKSAQGINALGLPPEMSGKVQEVSQAIDGFQLPAKDLNIPDLNLPDSPFKNLDGLQTSTATPFGEVGNVAGDLPVGALGDIPGVDDLKGISDITEKAGAYGKDLKNISAGNLGDAKEVSGALEGKAVDAAGLGGLPDKDNVLQDMTKSPVPLDPNAAKDQAQQQIQEVAIDHFAGKEQQLQEAMEKMSKLKRKYSSLNSLSEIPKKRPNEMKDKPLIERILPGVAMQFSGRGDDIYLDLNPYAGYRFTGRLTAGLGWNHRIGFDTRHYAFTNRPRIFGPRAFGEYRIGSGFAGRAEFEMMNTLIPPTVLKINSEVKYRQWVPSAFVGIKKQYKFFGNVRGTGMVMIRLFNPQHKSPYADLLNVRVGFEFPMKKKVKAVKAVKEEAAGAASPSP